jgi:adenosylcobinamide-GDP ribazoletransferase
VASDTSYSPLQLALKRPLRCFFTALRFLTIFPTFSGSKDDAEYFPGALFYFPVVGLVVGALGAGAATLMGAMVPALAAATLFAIYLSLVSGFFHLDGLADTADGFMGAREPERSLEIMKDSRIGVMGASALSSVLLLKTAAIYSLDSAEIAAALLIAPIAGRAAMVVFMPLLPAARVTHGLGTLFCSGSSRAAAWVSIIFFGLMALLAVPGKMVLIFVLCAALMIFFARLCLKKIGGITGDTLGCLCELVETTVLFGVALNF